MLGKEYASREPEYIGVLCLRNLLTAFIKNAAWFAKNTIALNRHEIPVSIRRASNKKSPLIFWGAAKVSREKLV
jgi:hypothetical protein